MSSTTPRIALLGTGLMGAPMARRLLAAGFPLTAWNRSRAKAEALAVHGATVAETAADAVRGADVVITMLDSGSVVTEVLFAGGVAEAMPAGATLIDMSSIPPSTARDHAARLAARGVDYLDAPVSGGTLGAEAGTLAIMAGGEADVFARAVPVFAPMGRAVRVGPSGSGQLAKLANQAIVGITIGAVAEALLLVERGGADPAAVREAIRGGFAESRILEVHGRRMIERDFVPGGKVVTQIKDLETIVRTADEIGLDLPLSRNVLRRYIELRDRQDAGDLDHAALFLQLEAANPL
ncbi:NAD(P)-dependent oxidoreductase [Terrihabitans rhizophilus]|uniref:NAD(P)-dependent oxidoreductase n=1 Tax=Terrihabitans rhizophilus TaxID=3092662 RepID=A0ABU4RLE8_9HYPH|nr:NAD(P)-dependent oxidoreductase [Terrihabitans sp. PJ23]MDX6805632.1 NAD(P)-dependent oxidoreductase [Terrihabitans sp. PJ23]